jgi:hypothetical protein
MKRTVGSSRKVAVVNRIFIHVISAKFHENRASGSRAEDRRTDMMKLIGAFFRLRERA